MNENYSKMGGTHFYQVESNNEMHKIRDRKASRIITRNDYAVSGKGVVSVSSKEVEPPYFTKQIVKYSKLMALYLLCYQHLL